MLSIPFQQEAATYACKIGRDLVCVAIYEYQSITMRRRSIRAGALLMMYGL